MEDKQQLLKEHLSAISRMGWEKRKKEDGTKKISEEMSRRAKRRWGTLRKSRIVLVVCSKCEATLQRTNKIKKGAICFSCKKEIRKEYANKRNKQK